MHDRVVYLATTYRRPAVNIHDLWIWKRKMKYLFLYIVRENIRQGNKEIYVDQVFLVLELEMSVIRIVYLYFYRTSSQLIGVGHFW